MTLGAKRSFVWERHKAAKTHKWLFSGAKASSQNGHSSTETHISITRIAERLGTPYQSIGGRMSKGRSAGQPSNAPCSIAHSLDRPLSAGWLGEKRNQCQSREARDGCRIRCLRPCSVSSRRERRSAPRGSVTCTTIFHELYEILPDAFSVRPAISRSEAVALFSKAIRECRWSGTLTGDAIAKRATAIHGKALAVPQVSFTVWTKLRAQGMLHAPGSRSSGRT